MRVIFYIGKHHKDFRKKIKKEIYVMELLDIKYTIFERSTVLLPKMDVDGYMVAGLNQIQETLYEELKNYVKILSSQLKIIQ